MPSHAMQNADDDQQHLDDEDELELEMDFRCTFCDRGFASRSARSAHQEVCCCFYAETHDVDSD